MIGYILLFFLMIRRPPIATRTDTLFPYTTLFRSLDAKDPRARYFLAVRKDIGGDHRGAIDDWFALLADTPQGAPWEADLRRTIEQVGAIHKIDVADRLAKTQTRALTPHEMPVAARGIPGPTRAELEAAAPLPKGKQTPMNTGMGAAPARKR